MALVSVLPRALDEPLPADVLADLASRAARRLDAVRPRPIAYPGGRWHVRLRVTDHYDVWLIGWGVDSRGRAARPRSRRPARSPSSAARSSSTRPRPTGGFRRQTLRPGEVQPSRPGTSTTSSTKGPAWRMSVHVYSPPLSLDDVLRRRPALRCGPRRLTCPGLVEDR